MKKHFRGSSLTLLLTLLFASLYIGVAVPESQGGPRSERRRGDRRVAAPDRVCGNAICEIGETAADCGADCAGGSDAVGMNSVHVYLGWGNPRSRRRDVRDRSQAILARVHLLRWRL